MPELRARYDRAAVSGRIVQPPFTELEARGRRRAHRKRVARLSGAATLVALVAIPLATLGTNSGGAPPAGFPDVQFPPELTNSGGLATSVSFYDTRHGVVTYTGLETYRPSDPSDRRRAAAEIECDTWISVTRDGGSTWSDLREAAGGEVTTLPSGEPVCASPAVVPIADGTLLSLDLPDTTRLAPHWWVPSAIAHISHDGGKTWRKYERELTPVGALPEGVTVGRVCMDEACEEISLGGYDPDSGDWMVLGDGPEGWADGAPEPMVAADGSIWIMGTDREGTGRLWVSRDRGRTWQDRSPDQLGIVDVAASEFATSDGQTAYLWAESPSQRKSALYRTTDGGQTWRQMPAGQPFTTMDGMRVARDGTLVVAEAPSGTQFVSRDRGETFRARGTPLHDAQRIADGWLAYALDDAAEDPIYGYLSEDGVSWRPFRIPHP